MYYTMILERAKELWGDREISKENTDEWYRSYFRVCEDLYNEFVAEGLIGTAEHIQHIYKEQIKFCPNIEDKL